MQLFYQPQIPEGVFHLDEEESKHAVRVLRLQNDDLLRITDGKGKIYETVITRADARKCEFRIMNTLDVPPDPYHIHLAIAPTKNADRLEWMLEKTVELGVHEITFILCDHSERRHLNTDRLEKKVVSAMKQSLKAYLPVLREEKKLPALIQESSGNIFKYIAYVDKENPDHLLHIAPKVQSYLILIGPEGDFSEKEIETALQHAFRPISLGKSRLRTETAGIAACHILNLINE